MSYTPNIKEMFSRGIRSKSTAISYSPSIPIPSYVRRIQSLDGDDVMILDALNRIYVWVGNGANPSEKKNAMNTAEVGKP